MLRVFSLQLVCKCKDYRRYLVKQWKLRSIFNGFVIAKTAVVWPNKGCCVQCSVGLFMPRLPLFFDQMMAVENVQLPSGI